jgi:hypothetical protein
LKGFRLVRNYVIAIAVIIGLQLFPITGVFLMIFMGMVWPALLLNIMLLHVGISAAAGTIDRLWLGIPLAVCCGWAAVSGFTYRSALETRAAVDAANEAVPGLKAEDRVFVVTSGDAWLRDQTAIAYAKVFKNASLYADGRRFELASDARCNSAPGTEWRAHGSVLRIGAPPKSTFNYAERSCVVSRVEPVPPENITLHVRNVLRPELGKFGPGKAVLAERHRPGAIPQKLGELRQGGVEYIKPYPWFIAGCTLNSGRGSWDCGFRPSRGALLVGQLDTYGRYYEELDQAAYVAQRFGVERY